MSNQVFEPLHLGGEFIPLDLVDPNPYNCRLSEDAEHVRKIADSIKTESLMQLPMGRRVDGRVQLAFGHTRLAAYKLLLAETGSRTYQDLPVIIRDLTDDQMFQHGVSENLARKDLTPIEEAKAMKRYAEEFSKTSVEVGALFNLSDSAVRNKIRLLDLPENIQAAFMEGKISEGAGREILSLFELPEEVRKTPQGYIYWKNAEQIVRMALDGVPAERVHAAIDDLVTHNAHEMDKISWNYDEDFPESPDLVGHCRKCPFNVVRNKTQYCLKPSCFAYKKDTWEAQYIAKASAISGILPYEYKDGVAQYPFEFNSSSMETMRSAREVHCPNLRLKYDPNTYRGIHGTLEEDGFPKAKIICQKKEQYCGCHTAIKSGLKDQLLGKTPEPEYVAVASSEDSGEPIQPEQAESAAITVDQLKDINRAAREKKKQSLAEIEAIRLDASKQYGAAILDINTNPKMLLNILRVLGGSYYQIKKESGGDFSENPQAWCDEIRFEIGRTMINKGASENYYYSEPDPAKFLTMVNDVLSEAGTPELIPAGDLPAAVSAETVEEEEEMEDDEKSGRFLADLDALDEKDS